MLELIASQVYVTIQQYTPIPVPSTESPSFDSLAVDLAEYIVLHVSPQMREPLVEYQSPSRVLHWAPAPQIRFQ